MEEKDYIEFRRQEEERIDKNIAQAREAINKHFVALCEVAAALPEPTRIRTPNGEFTFSPNVTFAYGRQKD